MKIDELFKSDVDLYRNIIAQESVVISTRIRLARNLSGFPFPNRATTAQKREILAAVNPVLNALPRLRRCYRYLVGALPPIERSLLVERHLISKELAGGTETAAYISRDQTCSVMVNEEDHLRIQIVHGGYHLHKAWKQASALDSELAAHLKIAFSKQLGHLTACPTNLGTGMRASAMLHLIGLSFTSQIEGVVNALNTDGLTVRGWFGEGSDASGCIFQVSNQHTLGISEDIIIRHFKHWVDNLIEMEENARLRLLEDNPFKFFDQIARSIVLLKNSRLLSQQEAMTSLSFARLSCDLGILPQTYRGLIDLFFIEGQPAHISTNVRDDVRTHAGREMRGNPDEEFEKLQLEVHRSTFFRHRSRIIPEPNFHLLDHNEIDELSDAAEAALAKQFAKLRDETDETDEDDAGEDTGESAGGAGSGTGNGAPSDKSDKPDQKADKKPARKPATRARKPRKGGAGSTGSTGATA